MPRAAEFIDVLVGIAGSPGEFIDSHAVLLGDELTLSGARGFASLGHNVLHRGSMSQEMKGQELPAVVLLQPC